MFPANNNAFYDDYYTQYNTLYNNNMNPTTSSNPQPRLSLDSGLGLTNDSFYSTDLNETQLMDITAATASDASTSFQSGPLECSPPTKWARVRTPPNRKRTARQNTKQEDLPPNFNVFSPPSNKKVRKMFSSPTNTMKTPESLRKSIRISSPSPFKVTFSKTPLKLSNNENVTGIHIGRSGTYYNKKVTGSASKRCLLPSKPDGFTFLGSPNSDVLDVPMETVFEGLGDLPTATPSKINAALEVGDDSMDYHQYAGIIESGSALSRYTYSSGPLLESHMRNVKSTPIVRTASRNLLKTNKDTFNVEPTKQINSFNKVVAEAPSNPDKMKEPFMKEQSVKPKRKSSKESVIQKTKEKEMKNWKITPFETPKKEVPLYSGRWLVISTGRTLAQQELFTDAKDFFQTHRPTNPDSETAGSARRIPTIARVTLFNHRYRSHRF
ncbi:hypothetical protein GCK72_014648 [Caenorhabditis remanei]|uniref:Uncharacterized protein n=1 Tax=Caenorhabditis remanei TaxID=31234 RepID=A0A6A5GS10_CAERE|nr:hypothetical protein GCK72_014648 [Caenorhabditis remanei]KAF1758190.1 hypothetical protein GCK72_014648 [Caenorhabditis remanei]